MYRSSRSLVALVGVLLGGPGCGDDDTSGSTTAKVDRGRYLVNNVGLCTFCHTPLKADGTRDQSMFLAGWDCFADFAPDMPGVGCLSSRNLTNHSTGLANVTDEQIRQALTMGIRSDGKFLSPAMPYWVFHNMTAEDIDAIIAFLRTVPGVDHLATANEAPTAQFNDSGPPSPPITEEEIPLPVDGAANRESAMRGRYLSAMAGLCLDCHTPDLPPGSDRLVDLSRPFAGGRLFPAEALGLPVPPYPQIVYTRNLTPHATGLGGWNAGQIKDAIVKGTDRDGNSVCAATHGSFTSPYAALEPGDLDDIVNYLLALPPIDHDTMVNCEGPPVQ
jgi:mono/diheme cytochrome c family protein